MHLYILISISIEMIRICIDRYVTLFIYFFELYRPNKSENLSENRRVERVKFEDIPETYKEDNIARARELVTTHFLRLDPNLSDVDQEKACKLVLRGLYESDQRWKSNKS